MIKEVAVEPEVMANWSYFRELWDDCGVSRGRLLSEFPSNWRELHVAHPFTKQGQLDKSILANRIYHMQYHLAVLIPVGNTLRVSFWYRKAGGKKLHARFVMTEHGGIQYDYGLDEGDCRGDTTIVSLMDHDLWQTVRGDFGLDASRAAAFDTASDCVVDIAGKG